MPWKMPCSTTLLLAVADQAKPARSASAIISAHTSSEFLGENICAPAFAGDIVAALSSSGHHERTRMTVFPARRSVALKVATASSRDETLPMFVFSLPSRTR